MGDGALGSRRGERNRCTRSIQRGHPIRSPRRRQSRWGVLAPGADADFVRWQVERLVVQVADARVAAWSTDPRSGTPGLPELSSDVALPTRIPLGEDV